MNRRGIRMALCATMMGLVTFQVKGEAGSPLSATTPTSASSPIRVACVGDSITQGVGTANPATEGYPAQLQEMLGPAWEVMNFGVGGRTLIRKADPLAFGRAQQSAPDVVVIMLGTNDSKPYCWDKHKANFVADYTNAITSFQNLDSKPAVLACLPPPASACLPRQLGDQAGRHRWRGCSGGQASGRIGGGGCH